MQMFFSLLISETPFFYALGWPYQSLYGKVTCLSVIYMLAFLSQKDGYSFTNYFLFFSSFPCCSQHYGHWTVMCMNDLSLYRIATVNSLMCEVGANRTVATGGIAKYFKYFFPGVPIFQMSQSVWDAIGYVVWLCTTDASGLGFYGFRRLILIEMGP